MPSDHIKKIVFLFNKGHFVDAEKQILQLIQANPNNYTYQNLLSIAYAKQNKTDLSIRTLKNIIINNPNFVDAHTNLAAIIDKKFEYLEASNLYKKLLKQCPNNIYLLRNYCNKLISLGKFEESKKLLNKLNKLTSATAEIFLSLGINFLKMQRVDQSLTCFKKVIAINPNLSSPYTNLGLIYTDYLKKYHEAINYLNKAIEIDPSNSTAFYNLGCAYNQLGNKEKGISYFKKAIKIKPDHHKAIYNLSLYHLATDDYKNGWSEYESRKKTLEINEKILNIPQTKIWEGDKFNSTLVVHAEQGVGDEILISSLYNELLNRQNNLSVSCDKRLIKIFKRSFPGIKFLDRKSSFTVSNESKHIFSFSLGKYLRTSVKSFKNNSKKWLCSDFKRDKEIQSLILQSNKVKIGISWKSPWAKQNNKNISLLQITSIMPKSFFELINLQYGDIKKDTEEVWKKDKKQLILFKNIDYKNDFDSLISLIMNCDAVVTSSNVTAHFSGALGKKTFLLVPINALWYWQERKNKSIWYPNVHIYRQNEFNNWDYPINKLKSDLVDLFKKKVKKLI